MDEHRIEIALDQLGEEWKRTSPDADKRIQESNRAVGIMIVGSSITTRYTLKQSGLHVEWDDDQGRVIRRFVRREVYDWCREKERENQFGYDSEYGERKQGYREQQQARKIGW